jgi:hypothetical protein
MREYLSEIKKWLDGWTFKGSGKSLRVNFVVGRLPERMIMERWLNNAQLKGTYRQ